MCDRPETLECGHLFQWLPSAPRLREPYFWSLVPGASHPQHFSERCHAKGRPFLIAQKINSVPIREFSQVWIRSPKQENLLRAVECLDLVTPSCGCLACDPNLCPGLTFGQKNFCGSVAHVTSKNWPVASWGCCPSCCVNSMPWNCTLANTNQTHSKMKASLHHSPLLMLQAIL